MQTDAGFAFSTYDVCRLAWLIWFVFVHISSRRRILGGEAEFGSTQPDFRLPPFSCKEVVPIDEQMNDSFFRLDNPIQFSGEEDNEKQIYLSGT